MSISYTREKTIHFEYQYEGRDGVAVVVSDAKAVIKQTTIDGHCMVEIDGIKFDIYPGFDSAETAANAVIKVLNYYTSSDLYDLPYYRETATRFLDWVCYQDFAPNYERVKRALALKLFAHPLPTEMTIAEAIEADEYRAYEE